MRERQRQAIRSIVEEVQGYLEVLTPVHIGSGIKWQRNLDFVVDAEGTYIVPESALIRYLQAHPEAIDRLEDEREREDLLWEVEDGIEYILPCESREILVFIRDGNGYPFVPGASLKGAIRTMLFRYFWDQLSPQKQADLLRNTQPRREWAAQPLLKEVFGKDPNHDLMRVLAVRDVQVRQQDLDLYRVFVLRLTDPEGKHYDWRGMRRRRTFSVIYAEMLRPGTTASFSMRLDRFLLEDERARSELHFDRKAFDFAKLARWANAYARKRLQRELAFLEKCNDGALNGLLNSLDALLQRIPDESDPEAGQRFLLRLGWGSGWQSMTGDYLEGEWLEKIRKRYRLNYDDRQRGRAHFPIFPKTRKIVFDGDRPAYLSGWVQIWLGKRPPADTRVTETQQVPAVEATPTVSTAPSLPKGLETGTIHSLNLKKMYGKVQPDKGGEPIRFDFQDAVMAGLEKGVRVSYRTVERGGELRAVEVKRYG